MPILVTPASQPGGDWEPVPEDKNTSKREWLETLEVGDLVCVRTSQLPFIFLGQTDRPNGVPHYASRTWFLVINPRTLKRSAVSWAQLKEY